MNTPPRPDLSQPSAYPAAAADSTNAIERATVVLIVLSAIPFVGGMLSLAAIVLGIILVTRNRLRLGLAAIILSPILNFATSFLAFLFFAGAFFAKNDAPFIPIP